MTQLNSLADAPNTLREYETIYILRPDTSNDTVGDVNSRVRGIIEEHGGKVINVDNWGKRRLAYEIDKELKGIYLYWQYLGNPTIVAEFERSMRLLDNVIRYLTVRLDEDVDPEARPSELEDDSYERAAATAADEEDLIMGASGSEESEEGDEGEGEGEEAGEGAESDATPEAAEGGGDASADAEEKSDD